MKVLSWFKKIVFKDKTRMKATKDDNELVRSLNEQSIKQSDRYYEQHQNKYVGWNPLTDLIETDSSPLTSVEISFLAYIDTTKVRELSVPGYWTYEYNIDFKYVISKLINNGYLIVSSIPDRLDRLKVNELKDILRKHNSKISGNKADLVQRIEENITTEQLAQHFSSYGDLYYISTSSGKQLMNSQPRSATKDIDFEDDCLSLLKQNDYNGAYKLVCERENMKPLKRGVNVDWERKLKQGIPSNTQNLYQNLANTAIPDIPFEALEAAKRTCIFCHMLGKRPDHQLFNRLTHHQYSAEATNYLKIVEYEFTKIKSSQEIIDLQDSYPNRYYEVLLSDDELVCESCMKFNKKRIPVSKAKVGVNYPPFHQDCSCTTVIYFSD
jgi:hypothetical protein